MSKKVPKAIAFSLLVIALFILPGQLTATNPDGPLVKYWVAFSDKEGSPYSLQDPQAFLSGRALERRARFNIPLSDNDLPVSPVYIDSLEQLGLTVLHTSKWFNAATVQTSDSSVIDELTKKPFIRKAELLYRSLPGTKSGFLRRDKTIPFEDFVYGTSFIQIDQINGQYLHQQGYRGAGMVIAVLDAGFYKANTFRVFDSLFTNGRILGYRDFVDPVSDIFAQSSHGMSVLSLIGGNLPGELTGTAPEASFWLLRSEDNSSEDRIEEANWVAAAEFADSVGADIINSSLGYSWFDDPSFSYSYSDMNGNNTLVTRAADMAAKKGILVVSSAGNAGNDPWRYITAPADGDSVLAIGAVDTNAVIAPFSSFGPSYDGRIKPDILGLGSYVKVYRPTDTIGFGFGTSFSAPVITGMAACLWQKHPYVNNYQLMQTIIKSSDRYQSPDDQYGHGLPDFLRAESLISGIRDQLNKHEQRQDVYPNPFDDFLYVKIPGGGVGTAELTITDMSGKLVKKLAMEVVVPGFIYLDDLDDLGRGVYLIRITMADAHIKAKAIKD